ncbi:MAG: hypothetical protein B0D92_00885 [Spirochaeta sp. LUC14_002_19_P3]|nr:MAG: hypothetical protein B0D92_00885 [Spirochaeta sp. LUC14_002_19_P3]
MKPLSIPETRLLLRRRTGIRFCILLTSTGILILAVLFSAVVGAVRLAPAAVLRAFWAGLSGTHTAALSPGELAVVWNIRLPRIVLSLFAGASLALGGTAMQGITRNPLASPYTLGISAAAAFGASLAIVLGLNRLIIPLAFLTALFSLLLVLLFAFKGQMRAESLILAGIAVMFAFSAGTSLLQYLADQDELARIVFWLMGSFSNASWLAVLILGLFFLGAMPVLHALARPMNILASGEESAKSLGVSPRRVHLRVLIVVTALSAVIVSFSGVIGFAGLAAPHIARRLLGGDYRLLFPASALCGAFLLLVSDTLARTLLGGTELPIGIITSFIGVPVLISILLSRRSSRREG